MGGRIGRLSPSVMHLKRGQIYTIDGAAIFTMGGATSVDREWRVPGRSWWEGEMPTEAELDAAEATLDGADWRVDYVITHCCATSMLERIYADGEVWQGSDALTEWFEVLEHRLDFKLWYFGHHHQDRSLPPDHCVLFRDIVPLGEMVDGDLPGDAAERTAELAATDVDPTLELDVPEDGEGPASS